MRKNKVDQQAGITQDEMLTICPNLTKRRLTHLTSEELLPKLKRISHVGSNRPVYVWEQEVIEQAKYLNDLIGQGIAHQGLFLALWLRGYEVPFEPILRLWLRPINTLLQNLTGGEQDPEDALWQISSSLSQYMEPKWKFSPRHDEVIRNVGIDAWRGLIEFFLDILAVPSYKPDKTTYKGVQKTIQRISGMAKANPQRGIGTQSQVSLADAKKTLSWFLSFRDFLSLPRLRDALINATVEEWEQAREDYLTLCRFLHNLAELFPRRNALLTLEMRQTMFLKWGSMLPPLFLSVRFYGYGDHIDEALDMLNGFLDAILADPDFCEVLFRM